MTLLFFLFEDILSVCLGKISLGQHREGSRSACGPKSRDFKLELKFYTNPSFYNGYDCHYEGHYLIDVSELFPSLHNLRLTLVRII